MPKIIEQVNSPDELKKLNIKELGEYADEVRELIVETVKRRGGHLASNLGTVELTIALHYVFDCPTDKLLFDVGHQTYTHKIITGRRDKFSELRTDGGITGFPNADESDCDVVTTGHSSTSLSVGLGLARARDLAGEKYNVVTVIGDGAFTGGMTFEALNDIGAHKEKMIIVLNDNKMSISKNVGAFAEYLSKLRLSKRYNTIKYDIKRGVGALPFFGDKIVDFLDKAKDDVKASLLPNKFFENLGIKYYGPFDGHEIGSLIDVLTRLKNNRGPVLLHVVTNKGNGVDEVMEQPDKYHGVSPHADVPSHETAFSSVVSKELCRLAANDNKVIAITAAMSIGTGLNEFAAAYPDRYFDVGIAEEHAAAMCAGFAASGYKPFFAVYSSFWQRAFDQTITDICIDNRPVTFLIDHAGAVGCDGVTHQGAFDLAALSMIPNMTVMQPKDGAELADMISFAASYNAPLAIRYSKSYDYDFDEHTGIESLKWERLACSDSNVIVLAVGNRAIKAALGLRGATVVNARVVKPLDVEYLDSLNDGAIVITVEDGIVRGGFGESVRAYFSQKRRAIEVVTIGYDDKFIQTLDETKILESGGLTTDALRNKIALAGIKLK